LKKMHGIFVHPKESHNTYYGNDAFTANEEK
jgi:hypothetical protein